jgi:hypothetical protein
LKKKDKVVRVKVVLDVTFKKKDKVMKDKGDIDEN